MEKTINGTPGGMGWRVTVTILAFFASIMGIILWLFFYAANFNIYQNIAVVAVILVGFIAVTGATWAAWGMKQAIQRDKNDYHRSSPDES